VTPTGSPAESYNKRGKKELKLNVSREEFLTQQLPRLFLKDAQERTGVRLEQFEGITKKDESIAILMSDGDYLVVPNNQAIFQCFVNSPHNIRKLITAIRLHRYRQALQGNATFFREGDNDCPLDILKRMVGASQTFCLVTYNDALGIYVGNCKSCYMHLSCPAITKVHDLKGQFQPPLAETTTPFARRTRGRPKSQELGGLGGKKRKQELVEPATVQTYYSHLTQSQLQIIASEMKVAVKAPYAGQTELERKQQLAKAILGRVESNKNATSTGAK
jgi:hypothetical protein